MIPPYYGLMARSENTSLLHHLLLCNIPPSYDILRAWNNYRLPNIGSPYSEFVIIGEFSPDQFPIIEEQLLDDANKLITNEIKMQSHAYMGNLSGLLYMYPDLFICRNPFHIIICNQLKGIFGPNETLWLLCREIFRSIKQRPTTIIYADVVETFRFLSECINKTNKSMIAEADILALYYDLRINGNQDEIITDNHRVLIKKYDNQLLIHLCKTTHKINATNCLNYVFQKLNIVIPEKYNLYQL